jgi:hypothetical protein
MESTSLQGYRHEGRMGVTLGRLQWLPCLNCSLQPTGSPPSPTHHQPIITPLPTLAGTCPWRSSFRPIDSPLASSIHQSTCDTLVRSLLSVIPTLIFNCHPAWAIPFSQASFLVSYCLSASACIVAKRKPLLRLRFRIQLQLHQQEYTVSAAREAIHSSRFTLSGCSMKHLPGSPSALLSFNGLPPLLRHRSA